MALKKFPGFIDVHVHLREPGATHKEDFYTGSRAAIKGGFTFIIDMPNNVVPTITLERLDEKISLSQKAICDIGFYYGTDGKNIETFREVSFKPEVFGLKIYCNHTTGDLLVNDLALLENVFENWKSQKPILVHAEGMQLAAVIALAKLYDRKLHVCHISQEIEVELVRRAKLQGQNISAGVCPHHLFFFTGSQTEKLKGYAVMKPPIGSKCNQDALWQGLNDGTIDIIETDHAPHTKDEKEKEPPAFGVPGLETATGLMFKAIKEGKIIEDDIVKLLYTNPKKIFNIPEQNNTYIELDPEIPYLCGEDNYETKCGWSPFHGWELYGKIQKVVFKGKMILDNGVLVV